MIRPFTSNFFNRVSQMDKKQKIRVVVIVPVVAVLIVLGAVLTFVLIAASSGHAPASVASSSVENGALAMPIGGDVPPCDFNALVGLTSTAASEQIANLNRPIRVIAPGMAVTQDFSAARINLMIDDHDTVQSVTCG